jgi:hypothetical protein
LLAAYRLDDRTAAESDALAQHLATCEACQSVEANFRRVGAFVRHMPTLVPPPSFQAAVFAAIEVEKHRLAKHESPTARLARAETDPRLPVVRARPVPSVSGRRASRVSVPAVTAMAAVLLLGVFTARELPGASFSTLGNALGTLFGGSTPKVSYYQPNARFSEAVGALATGGWLVYSAADRAGESMLFAEDRHSLRQTALLGSPVNDGLTLRALTDSWAIWNEGRDDGGTDWTLYARRLPGTPGNAAQTLTLARNANTSSDGASDAPIQLTELWSGGDKVLAAALTRGGSSVILQWNLSGGDPSARVIARASQGGRLLANPTELNGAYYWSEVWLDADAHLHSSIWQGDGAGQARQLSSDDSAFAPQAGQGTLLWIEAHNAGAQGAQPGNLSGLARALAAVSGQVEARDVASGHTWQIADATAASSLQAAGPFVLWATGGQEHTYDLRTQNATEVEAQVRAASFAEAGDTALTWGKRTGSLAVLDR